MIRLTKLNQKKFLLNCELIESVEATPDTVITLRNGKLYIVAEEPDEVMARVMEYKKQVFQSFVCPQHANPPQDDADKSLMV